MRIIVSDNSCWPEYPPINMPYDEYKEKARRMVEEFKPGDKVRLRQPDDESKWHCADPAVTDMTKYSHGVVSKYNDPRDHAVAVDLEDDMFYYYSPFCVVKYGEPDDD